MNYQNMKDCLTLSFRFIATSNKNVKVCSGLIHDMKEIVNIDMDRLYNYHIKLEELQRLKDELYIY